MRKFTAVYEDSKKDTLQMKAALYEKQKQAIVSILKEQYMITGKIENLPLEEQKQMACRLMEYWSPKTGIKKAGIKLLNENEIVLTPQSTKDDIKLYIEHQVKKHINAITEAYRNNNVHDVTESFKDSIEPRIHKTLKETFINNTVWNLIEHRIKNGI